MGSRYGSWPRDIVEAEFGIVERSAGIDITDQFFPVGASAGIL